MCKLTDPSSKETKETTAQTTNQSDESKISNPAPSTTSSSTITTTKPNNSNKNQKSKTRRSKRTKESDLVLARKRNKAKRKIQSLHTKKNKKSEDDGGFASFLPSLALLVVGAFAIMAKMGFRGRPTTAGIDLGTTNSVICIQSPSKSGKFVSL